MNEATLIALKEMALTLGTTTEYLWAALLRQAPITGTLHVVLLVVFLAVLSYSMYQFVKQLNLTAVPETLPVYSTLAVLSGLGLIIEILLLNRTLSALLNPEYWALMQILGK